MHFTVAIISLLTASMTAAIATPDLATRALMSEVHVRDGEDSGFINGTALSARDDGYHNYCEAPCQGHVCVLGARPQCCLNQGECGCCWWIDDPAYIAKTKPVDLPAKKGGALDSDSRNKIADSPSRNKVA